MCPREWDAGFGSVKHGGGLIRRTSGGSYVAEVNRDGRRQRKTFTGITGARGWIDALVTNRDKLGRKATAWTVLDEAVGGRAALAMLVDKVSEASAGDLDALELLIRQRREELGS